MLGSYLHKQIYLATHMHVHTHACTHAHTHHIQIIFYTCTAANVSPLSSLEMSTVFSLSHPSSSSRTIQNCWYRKACSSLLLLFSEVKARLFQALSSWQHLSLSISRVLGLPLVSFCPSESKAFLRVSWLVNSTVNC